MGRPATAWSRLEVGGKLDRWIGSLNSTSIAAGIEELLAATGVDFHACTGLWRLAARAYHAAKRDADKHRCIAQTAEAMVAEADRLLAGQGHHAAMLASHELGNAIQQLHVSRGCGNAAPSSGTG